MLLALLAAPLLLVALGGRARARLAAQHADTCRADASPFARHAARGDSYLVGVGKADITGPVAEVTLAGYGKFEQAGTGLRQRLYSRAFIVGDAAKPEDRVVYLVLDDLAGDTAVRYGVLEALAGLGDEYAVYGPHNVALTATHTHAGPGGWFNYLLHQAPTWGFDAQSYRAVVDGVVLSIRRAHESMQQGHLDVGTTEIRNASINRSMYAYLRNPEEERARYADSVDTTMTALRFRRASDGRAVGVLTWFAVHGTSLHNNNTHVAGDNKGVAAWLLERSMDMDDSAAEGFVAGFSQGSEGDVSPNILGAWCDDGSGVACSGDASTCADGRPAACQSRGPEFRARDRGVSSCFEIGRRQAEGAREIYDSLDASATPMTGPVKSFHFFHDMSYWRFRLPNGTEVSTCPGAFGYSTAAGTTDGCGMGGFTQATTRAPRLRPWSFFRELEGSLWTSLFRLVRTPTARQRACQGVKPVLLDVGGVSFPYAWGPNVVDVQMLRIGQVFVAVSPSEVTTMSGRRWRAAIAAQAKAVCGEEAAIALVAGPANTYAHYVATPEEYTAQRYEGASTMFGPFQLPAYINLTVGNMHYLAAGSAGMAAGAARAAARAPNHANSSLSLFPGVVFDGAPASRPFGTAVRQPRRAYRAGEVVRATFQAANPRNNVRLEGTFAAVEQRVAPGRWVRVADDGDWFLVFSWRRTRRLRGHSEAEVAWETGRDTAPGTYRLRYYGDAKRLLGGVEGFEGASESFTLGAA